MFASIPAYFSGFLSRQRTPRQTAMLVLAAVGIVGLLALAASLLYPHSANGPDVAWRGQASLGGAALALLGGGAATALYVHRRRRWRAMQDDLNTKAARYVVLSLAPRPDQKAVDASKLGLYKRLSAYVERANEWPSTHLVFGWLGTQDRVYAMLAVPAEQRRPLGVELNTDFVGLDVVEMAPAPDQVPFGDENEVMVSPRHYLGQGPVFTGQVAVYWQDLVLAGDDSLPLLNDAALKRSTVVPALLSLLDGVPGGETWGVQVLVRAAPPGKAGHVLRAVQRRQLEARGGGRQGARGGSALSLSKGQRAAPILAEERELLKARSEKAEQALFEVVLRTWAVAPRPERAQQAVEQLSRLLVAQTRRGRGAGLRVAGQGQAGQVVADCHWPVGTPSPGVWGHRELAGLFHLPGQDVAAISGKLATARARKLPPVPAVRRAMGQGRNDLLVLGTHRYSTGETVEVGIPWNDTKVHIFIVGLTRQVSRYVLRPDGLFRFPNGGLYLVEAERARRYNFGRILDKVQRYERVRRTRRDLWQRHWGVETFPPVLMLMLDPDRHVARLRKEAQGNQVRFLFRAWADLLKGDDPLDGWRSWRDGARVTLGQP